MPGLSSVAREAESRLQRNALVCVGAAIEAARSGEENPNRAAHLVRREMKRLRALLQLVPKPLPDWVEQLGSGATAIHRKLAELRDGCVVEATLGKIRLRHPRRWKVILPPLPSSVTMATGETATSWEAVGERLEELKTTIAAKTRGVAPKVDLGEALARTYRRARRARAIVPAAINQEAVHAWRKAMYRLCFQLQLADPLLTRPAREMQAGLASLTRKLGRCGDLAMARERLEGLRLAGVGARTRADLFEWIERRRCKIAEGILRSTEEYFERRPREFAKWCLRRGR